jgi:hypothetical protein
MLEREEYVEQAHFFTTLAARKQAGISTQEVLASVREEILSTTKLPLAIDFLNDELKLNGVFHTAMAKLAHYFTPFQTFVVGEAEDDQGRFDIIMALEILSREARYRAQGATAQGIFLYEFESLSRNRLRYDRGLEAIAGDSVFDRSWKDWIMLVRHQVGLVDFADLIYVRSQHYAQSKGRSLADEEGQEPEHAVLFGEGEGRIARANRGKDPLLLFSALHRHLGYPEVPRPPKADESPQLIPLLARRVERLEARLKLVEDEVKGGIDITHFYAQGGEGRPPEKPLNSE